MAETTQQLKDLSNLLQSYVDKHGEQLKELGDSSKDIEQKLDDQAGEILQLTNQYKELAEKQENELATLVAQNKATKSDVKRLSMKKQLKAALGQEEIAKQIASFARNPQGKNFEFDLQSVIKDMTIDSNITGEIARVDRKEDVAADPERLEHIRDYMTVTPSDSESVSIPREVSTTGAVGTNAEGAALNNVDRTLQEFLFPHEDISGITRLSERMAVDAPFLRAFLSTSLVEEILSEEDNQIFNGNGTSPNLKGLISEGVAFAPPARFQDAANLSGNANEYDVLNAACAQARGKNYAPTVCFVSSEVYHYMIGLKDAESRYLFGAALLAGNQPRVANVPLIPTTAIASDAFVVADTSRAAMLSEREGLNVRFSTEDRDNFQKRLISIAAFERVALITRLPAGVVRGQFASAKVDLDPSLT